MSTTVFITHFLKNARSKAWAYGLALCLCLVAGLGQPAAAADLTQWRVERGEDGVYVSAVVEFELRPVVEDALLKGIPMFFVVEADVYQSRWYWTDRRVVSTTRTIRLAFQPLTRRWRVNIVSGLANTSAGLRATLNQNYDTMTEALSAVQRLSHWKIAEAGELDPEAVYKLEFAFHLDLSQLPRPFQIGVAGQKDWTVAVQQIERLHPGALKAVPASAEKAKPGLAPLKEAER